MVSTQDFAHEVWQSLENIRDRLAVLETEVRHSRRDLLRLETSLHAHFADHRRPGQSGGGKSENGNGASINIRFIRITVVGISVVGGGLVEGFCGLGIAVGWW